MGALDRDRAPHTALGSAIHPCINPCPQPSSGRELTTCNCASSSVALTGSLPTCRPCPLRSRQPD